MDNVVDLLFAIGSSTVGLITGLFGLLATICSFAFRGTTPGKWLLRFGIGAIAISPALIWINEHNLRMELQKGRPHVLIEGAPAATVHAYTLRDPRNPVFPETAYLPGYMIGKGTNAESLLYSVTNLGDITAKEVKYLYRIKKTDLIGLETDVRLPELPARIEVLLPKHSVLRSIPIPNGTFYSGTESVSDLRITLVVTYLGLPSDKNVYFYRVILKSKQFAGPPETLTLASGGMVEDLSDEGIATNPDDLLR